MCHITSMDKYSIIGYLTVPCSIAFAFGLSFGFLSNSWTILSIFLSSIGIGLAIAIFSIQQSQNQKIKELGIEQHQLVQKMNSILAREEENKKADYKLMCQGLLKD